MGLGRLRGSLGEGYLSSSSMATCQTLFSRHLVNSHSVSFAHSVRAVLVTEMHPKHTQSIHPHGELLNVDSRDGCLGMWFTARHPTPSERHVREWRWMKCTTPVTATRHRRLRAYFTDSNER